MFSPIARRAIDRSYAEFLLQLCLLVIVQTFHMWPASFGYRFSLDSEPFDPTNISRFTVQLCNRKVEVNGVLMTIDAFCLQFTFPDLVQARRTLVYYCPRRIIAPGYERRTLEASLREEVLAWISGDPRENTLMLEHAMNLQRRMRVLLSELPAHAFILQLPADTRVGQAVQVDSGHSCVSVVDENTMGITATTIDDYSITYECPRNRVPDPAALRGRLLRYYQDAR